MRMRLVSDKAKTGEMGREGSINTKVRSAGLGDWIRDEGKGVITDIPPSGPSSRMAADALPERDNLEGGGRGGCGGQNWKRGQDESSFGYAELLLSFFL